MKDYFKKPIQTPIDAEHFFWLLFSDNLLFHPEDDPADIIEVASKSEDRRTFTDEEAVGLRMRLDEVWEVYDDPCKFILDTFYTEPSYEDQAHTEFYNENL